MGLMLHAMVIGWLPFNCKDKQELEKQIVKNTLDYKKIKRIKNSSIKDEKKKLLNSRLKTISDECIDLVEKMLCKEPSNRIDLIDIYDHPFVTKHKYGQTE